MNFDPGPDAELPISHADVERVRAFVQVLVGPDLTINRVDREPSPLGDFRHQLVGEDVVQVLIRGVQSADDPVGKEPSRGGDEDLQRHHRGRVPALLGDVDVNHADGGEGRVAAVRHLNRAQHEV